MLILFIDLDYYLFEKMFLRCKVCVILSLCKLFSLIFIRSWWYFIVDETNHF